MSSRVAFFVGGSLRNLPFWFWLLLSTLGLSIEYVTGSSGVTEGNGKKTIIEMRYHQH
jgi:hypothetical protein